MFYDLLIFVRWLIIAALLTFSLDYIQHELRRRYSKAGKDLEPLKITTFFGRERPWWIVCSAVVVSLPWAPEPKVVMWVGGLMMISFISYTQWEKLENNKPKYAILGVLGIITIAIFTRIFIFS